MRYLVARGERGKGETLPGAKWRRSEGAYIVTKPVYGLSPQDDEI